MVSCLMTSFCFFLRSWQTAAVFQQKEFFCHRHSWMLPELHAQRGVLDGQKAGTLDNWASGIFAFWAECSFGVPLRRCTPLAGAPCTFSPRVHHAEIIENKGIEPCLSKTASGELVSLRTVSPLHGRVHFSRIHFLIYHAEYDILQSESCS